jgi:hypothetical protein
VLKVGSFYLNEILLEYLMASGSYYHSIGVNEPNMLVRRMSGLDDD